MAAVDFDAFVAARSAALLRTAYLLTRDHALAEDLLQTALTKAWFSWTKIHGDPERVVDKVPDGAPTDLGDGRIAVAVYAESPAAERVGSYDLSRLVERDGHLWRLRTVHRGGEGAFSFIAEVSAEDHPVLTYIVADRVSGRVRTVLDGKNVGGLMGSGGAQDGPILWPGDNREVGVVTTRNNSRAILAIAEYERVD